MSKIAHIVAVRVNSLGDLGFGISDNPGDVRHVLEEGEVWIGPRQVLETDFDFVQPIPYIVIRDGDRVLSYSRGAAGGDQRLHAKVSVGFGGHVDLADAVTDANGVIDLQATLLKALIRELEEELGIKLDQLTDAQRAAIAEWTHVISSTASEVDRVHVGFVASIDVANLPGLDPAKFEDVIENASWVTATDLTTARDEGFIELEPWTDLVLSHPFPVGA